MHNSIKLTLYIDGWCAFCKAFAKKLTNYDKHNYIVIKDIRTSSHPLIDTEKAMKALASIDRNGNVYYGFDTIHKICLILPILFVFTPISYILKISRLGSFLYNELSFRRNIVPLHCDEKKCE
jgi:predicted DCC family thiol-disulfide oxidoreductase YuxK